jgi:hypothetical protein
MQMSIKNKYGLEIDSKDTVSNKNITQQQANKIKAVISRDKLVKKSTLERTKIETERRHKIYMNSNKINPFTALVDNGTITESQADKIILKQLYLQHDEMLKSLAKYSKQ